MKIRRYQPEDAIKPLISGAVKDIEPEHYSREQQRHLEEVIPDMNVEFAEKDRYVYFVAVEGGEIVGVAGFQKESGTVAGIFVDPDLKESGIGSKLMQKLEEKAIEENLEQIETLASLEAIEFYKKNDYEVKEERKQDIEGRDIGVKVMVKEL
jgi:N-acetylglutamate synthase-like GNAT family acetyltransferase